MRKLEKANCRYGAPMGRSGKDINTAGPVKMHLQHIPLDSGGYDAGGAYWGLRPREPRTVLCQPIGSAGNAVRSYMATKRIYWYWWNGNKPSAAKPLIISGFIDAFDREHAKQQVLENYPEATFYR